MARTTLLAFAGLSIIVAIGLLTFVPLIFAKTKVVYQYGPITQVVYVLLSLGVAIISFGVLRDATARFDATLGTFASAANLTGSAACAAIFFLMLNNGLSLFDHKLLKFRSSSPNDSLPAASRLSVVSRNYSSEESVGPNNEVRASILRSTQEFELRYRSPDGLEWRIDKVLPSDCYDVDQGSFKNACNSDLIIYVSRQSCLTSFLPAIDKFEHDRTLRGFLDSLIELANRQMPHVNASTRYSTSAEQVVPLKELSGGALPLCSLLKIVETRYNGMPERPPIEIRADCHQIEVLGQNQKPKHVTSDLCSRRLGP